MMKKLIFCILLCFLATASNAAILFQDNFEYAVARTGTAADAFVSTGGWDFVKCNNSTASAGGMVFSTETSIPGFSGSFPGTSSSRVMRVEVLSGTNQSQTDAYVKFGDTTINSNQIPGDVWIQHWIYINNYGDEASQFAGRVKFLYPCDGAHTCANDADDDGNLWMIVPGPGVAGNNYWYFTSRDDTAWDVGDATDRPWDTSGNTYQKMNQNIDAVTRVDPNGWYLIKYHFDTTSTSGNKYELWIAQQGGDFVKVSNWEGGVTSNFTWNLAEGYPGGHSMLAVFTTFPGPNNSEFYDSWIYLDDFVIAESESDLPTYPANAIQGGSASGGSVQ